MTNSSAPFGRVLTAMVTPFTENGQIDYEAAVELAVDLVDLGNDGLVINGTTGEAPTTSDAEKRTLVGEIVKAVGHRACIVAGVGSNDTSHTIELSRDAAEAGADGALVVTPYYNKPPQAGLLRHFTAVADSSDLPVMLYDIPGRAGVSIAHHTMLRLAEHPNIVANKDAKGDPFAAARVMAETELAYYAGDDGLVLPLLSVGAIGVVSVVGHLVADRLAAMIEAFAAGDVDTAKDINAGLVPVVVGIMTRTQGVIMVKAALDLLERSGGGALRLPLVEATQEEREQLRADLRLGGFEL